MAHMRLEMTRTGYGPVVVADRPRRVVLPIAWYARKPAWMTHVDGPWLRFGSRFAFQSHLEKAKR